jgi:stage II sporulation protein D
VPSEVFLWPKNSNEVDVIAVLNLDEYLQGVVPSEMPLEWPDEALKVQAVMARSYVTHQMQKNKNRYYHVDSSVLDQKYTYTLNWSLDQQRKIQKVISNTHKEVLKNKSGHIVKALYHADCGGQTVKASQVWGGGYATQEVKDSHCPAPRNASWVYTVSKDILKQKLLLKGSLKSIKLYQTHGIRPDEVEFKTDSETHKISPQVLRSAFGYQNVKSAAFEIRMDSQNVIFKGKGSGHGVGLCQNGAKYLAKANKNYK